MGSHHELVCSACGAAIENVEVLSTKTTQNSSESLMRKQGFYGSKKSREKKVAADKNVKRQKRNFSGKPVSTKKAKYKKDKRRKYNGKSTLYDLKRLGKKLIDEIEDIID